MDRKGMILVALLLTLLLSVFTGCSNRSETVQETQASPCVKSDGYEKFCQLDIGMTEHEVRDILGQPARVDKAYSYYTVTVNGQEMELTVWFDAATGQMIYFSGNFSDSLYRAEFADSKTDLSAAGRLESDGISTYDDCVAAFKTPGYLTAMDSSGVKEYLWVDKNDGYMRIAFRADGTIKTFRGIC